MQDFFRETKTKLYFEYTDSLNFPPHIHDDIELIYIRRGSGYAFCDGKEYYLCDNSFFITFPNQVHHYSDCLTGGDYILLIIKPSRLFSYENMFYDALPQSSLYIPKKDDDNLAFLLETALSEFLRDGDSPQITAYLTLVFGKLLKNIDVEKSRVSRDCVSSILQYCARHYKENVTIFDISESLHISRSHISHIFSSRLNMNFCDYINSLRLSDALNLLEDKNLPITEISDRSGFSTIRTFNRAFQKRFGSSPSQYRKGLTQKNT
ncbi:MAG: AraC family transcriptional regulator [Oscillospiraceae bacterium]|nr:AraC family transcriptional regulator [Oscillospiraceae bacterium]